MVTKSQAKKDYKKLWEQYREGARRLWYEDGEIEIDEGATVSVSDDGGAYVQAWVWVSDSDLEQ